jgi:carbamoyltransferase
MAYNILGVNLSHNSSIALVSDGELIFYLEEERISRIKQDGNPYLILNKYLKEFDINFIYFIGIGSSDYSLVNVLCKSLKDLLKTPHISPTHHFAHASCAFLHSGFKEANNIVVDFGGFISEQHQESESIFYFNQNFFNNEKIYSSYNDISNGTIGITKTYSTIGKLMGFYPLEGGKLMGLSSYGKKNNYLTEPFFINEKGNPQLFKSNSYSEARLLNHKMWTSDPSDFQQNLKNKNLSQEGKDIAYKIQQESQEEIAKLVEKALQINNCTNITLSGGFGLNCVNNYYLQKRFPNVNFYFEPISHDGGTAIGIAYARWKELNPNFKFKPLKSLYLGPQYSKEQLLESIQKYVSN